LDIGSSWVIGISVFQFSNVQLLNRFEKIHGVFDKSSDSDFNHIKSFSVSELISTLGCDLIAF